MSKENRETLNAYANGGWREYVENVPKEPFQNPKIVENWIQRGVDGLVKSAKIFEIGSASGADAWKFKKLGFNIITSDAVDGFVNFLRKNGFSETRKFNILSDEFPEKYDAVFANAVLVHLTYDEVREAVKKIFNDLNDGGRMIASFKWDDTLDEEWTTKHMNAGRRYMSYWRDPEELVNMIKTAGFSTVEIDKPEKKWWHIIARKEGK
jgi:2-polyprenyl-3-methyl-5-hydroxy-6-metoxy-1,4-benzoquinol methylase